MCSGSASEKTKTPILVPSIVLPKLALCRGGTTDMSGFRRFVIGAAQFSMVVMIIGFVIGGGVLGVAARSSVLLMMQSG